MISIKKIFELNPIFSLVENLNIYSNAYTLAKIEVKVSIGCQYIPLTYTDLIPRIQYHFRPSFNFNIKAFSKFSFLHLTNFRGFPRTTYSINWPKISHGSQEEGMKIILNIAGIPKFANSIWSGFSSNIVIFDFYSFLCCCSFILEIHLVCFSLLLHFVDRVYIGHIKILVEFIASLALQLGEKSLFRQFWDIVAISNFELLYFLNVT